jgi:2-polyprenyl-6-methoxyphenol hydroxylase-like FAD-dependent oxidoreductase
MPDSQTVKSPKVIIAGAGLTGLTMAILLEKAGIEYQVLERSSEVQQTLGGAIILSFNVMPLMEQLGVLDQIEAISFPIETTMIYKEDMEVIREINLRSNRKMYVILHTPLVFVVIIYDTIGCSGCRHAIALHVACLSVS